MCKEYNICIWLKISTVHHEEGDGYLSEVRSAFFTAECGSQAPPGVRQKELPGGLLPSCNGIPSPLLLHYDCVASFPSHTLQACSNTFVGYAL